MVSDPSAQVRQVLEDRYACLVEYSPVCIHEVDVEGRLLSMNPKGLEMMGVANFGAIAGMAYLDAVCDVDRGRVQCLMTKALAGERVDFEFAAAGEGRRAIFASNFIPILGDDGEVLKMMGITEDVTDQRANERRMQESEERYRTVVQASRAGYCVADGAGVLIETNDALCTLIGVEREELLGGELAHSLWGDRGAWLADAMKQGASGARETTIKRPDGSVAIAQLELHTLDEEWGGGARSFVLAHDVTEHRLKERQLLQAQKMEAVGQLTGGIAHDFNNLLGVMSGNAELLEGTLQGADPNTLDPLREIIEAASRAAELTRQLLTFSRKQTLRPQALQLSAIVDDMLRMLRRTLGEHINVTAQHCDQLWACMADPGQLSGALLNLSINARDAMALGGTLRIATCNVPKPEAERLGLRPADYVCVTVEDDGCGMDEVVRAQAFDPFFTTKAAGKGTGLGLSMVHGFVSQSGGEVTVDSEPRAGTRVRLYLPRTVAVPDPTDEIQGGRAPALFAGRTILVLEDDSALRRLLVGVLEGHDCNVLAAEDGDAAMQMLSRIPGIDLLLSDLVLPGRASGLDVRDHCERHHPKVKRLFMSGYAEHPTLRANLPNGETLLDKPFRLADLTAALNATFS